MQRHHRIFALSVALAVLTVAVFAEVLRCDFVDYDDGIYVSRNPDVSAGLNARTVRWAFTSLRTSNWHPLTWLSLQLDAQCYGLNPTGYHLTNLALHTATVVLLFLVLCGMTRAVWRSAAVAALFAVHPLHVESVAWVAERKDVLSGLFWMLTLAAYLHYARRPGLGRYLLVFLALALGLMAKPMLVTLPCVLCLLDYWPLRRLSWSPPDPAPEAGPPRFPQASLRLLVWEKLPLFLLGGVAAWLTSMVQLSDAGSIAGLPLAVRISNALTAYVAYLGQVFWPVGLCVFYPHARLADPWWQTLAAAGLLLTISLFVLLQIRRRPYLAVGWLWYLGTLVPVIGLIQVGEQARADRYTYIPLIGFFLMLAWGLPDLLARLRRPGLVLLPLAGAVLVVCIVCTHLQVRSSRSPLSLWGHAAAVNPHNAFAHYRLSVAHALDGRWDEAVASARQAVENDPNHYRYRIRLITVLRESGQKEAEDEENLKLIQMLSRKGAVRP